MSPFATAELGRRAEVKPNRKEYMIDVRRDATACVWVATSDTVPGVAVEAATCHEVLRVIEDVLPDLFRENGLEYSDGIVSVAFDTRVETIRIADV